MSTGSCAIQLQLLQRDTEKPLILRHALRQEIPIIRLNYFDSQIANIIKYYLVISTLRNVSEDDLDYTF